MTVIVGPAVDDRRSVVFIAIRPNGSRRKNLKVLHDNYFYTFTCNAWLKTQSSFFCVQLCKNLSRPIILSPLRIEGHIIARKHW